MPTTSKSGKKSAGQRRPKAAATATRAQERCSCDGEDYHAEGCELACAKPMGHTWCERRKGHKGKCRPADGPEGAVCRDGCSECHSLVGGPLWKEAWA